MAFSFNPATGLLDTSQFPTNPINETAARTQFMTLFNQVKDYMNGSLRTEILQSAYPVGSIYVNASVTTNPGTLLGFGTWVEFGSGRVMVGQDTGQTEFDVLEETGGEKAHTLTTAEIPSHTHPTYLDDTKIYASPGGGSEFFAGKTLGTLATKSTGGDTAHNNLQPYVVVKMWKRTA